MVLNDSCARRSLPLTTYAFQYDTTHKLEIAMKRLWSAGTAVMLLLSTTAQAHTHLQSSMPADQAAVSSAPTQIMLHFSEPTRLTALSVHKEGDKEASAVSSLPKEASAALTVPVQVAGPGKYKVNWRAVGKDNHVMSGALQFTVTGK
jgi:methionine-rich copper-binding protein CopC